MDAKILCLGVLSRNPCSGYEIRKAFEEGPFLHCQDVGFGSIYPALKKLTEEGLVVCREETQVNRPDKKVYHITPKGRQALFDAINQPPAPDRLRSDFLFVMFFSDLLTPGQLDRLIGQRIDHHRGLLSVIDGMDPSNPTERFVRNYARAIHQAAIDYLENSQHEIVGAAFQRDVAE